MLKIDVYTKPQMHHHMPRCDDFLQGIRAMGDAVEVRYCEGDNPLPACERGDFALFWSGYFPKVIAAYDDYLLMEGSRWLGPSDEAVTVGWNGFHHGANYFADWNDPARRHVSKLALQPWQYNPNGYVLIFGQVAGDFAARDVVLTDFYNEAVAYYLAKACAVRFRPHPHSDRDDGPEGIERSNEPLAEALAGSRLTVSWSTTAACDAIAAGVPSVAICPESMAQPIAVSAFNVSPPRPDRECWLNYLGQTEWSWDEVRAGVAWRQLRRRFSDMEQAA